MRNNKIGDMTVGRISPQLIRFAIPMILGNFFQLTYNAADSIIVGRFVGTNALAAVGAASPIMNIVIFIIVGICLGMSVLMSEFFGAADIPKLKREISTSLIAGGVFTIAIVVSGIFLSGPILRLMNTPEVIMNDATRYLQIIFFGLIFTFAYNIYASTLRSMGNSKIPLYFLITSALLNILMDLLFVVVLGMGTKGAAIATVVAEAVSAFLCLFYVWLKIPVLHFRRTDFVFDRSLLRDTVNYSSVAAMQQICLYVGKLLVQGVVNPLGVHAIAAFNAVNRVDDFVFLPEQSIANSATTFIAQNRGAEKYKRIRKGFMAGLKIELIYSLILMFTIFVSARWLTVVFIGKEAEGVVQSGVYYLHAMAFFYFLPALTNIIQGYFRGMGRLKVTLNSTFIQIVGRVLAAFLLAPRFGLFGVALACLAGWLVMLAYELPVFFKAWRNR
ncbi:MATE family efflux transporter [uncultured Bacteroides sp.]|uniref:MATE family efflux transporter n=1 Tax=uncultured Bacteroides sp. TaxID=162156 RepID=UPI002AA8CFB2|nr:MATE family efflux transporter [uncultured Bacteroides sp.]